MFIVYVSSAFRKRSTIFKRNSNISIATFCCYIPCYKNICVWIITKIWFNKFGFKFNCCTIFTFFAIVCVILITDNIPFSCYKFWRFIISITPKIYNLLSFDFYTWSKLNNCCSILWKFKSRFFWLFNDEKHCCSIISFKSSNTPSFLSNLPIKLICSFKSGFSNSICLLNLLQLICTVLKSTHNPIIYMSCNHCFFPFR